jgi:hypothetical protein
MTNTSYGNSYTSVSTVNQYSETNLMHFLFNLVRVRASTCFEHYLLVLRRCYTNRTWHFSFVLCQLAAPNFDPGAAN